MKFTAEIDIMPHKELLDPQGKAVANGLKNLKLDAVADVRIGKHVSMSLEAATKAEAEQQVEEACQKLLANPIMEGFVFQVEPA